MAEHNLGASDVEHEGIEQRGSALQAARQPWGEPEVEEPAAYRVIAVEPGDTRARPTFKSASVLAVEGVSFIVANLAMPCLTSGVLTQNS